MAKIKSDILHVKGIDAGIYTEDYRNEYISLTDIARYRNSEAPASPYRTGCATATPVSFLVFGRVSTTPTLTVCNSTRLKPRPASTASS